jgi:GT2 family glycosyltransferase/glycosyltransferase involved in cell wall biosynthesis/protein-L-isoaspartate O-methyltransferase
MQLMLKRTAGAPRLIEWTGDRCVPWAPDVQTVYEHLHRYLWAARLLTGRRVLDLASGEGFGASILLESATEVVGLDIDERSVEHASLNYVADNLTFVVGDARDLSAFDDGTFDAVVAFEMIEHVEKQEQVLAEVRRVLTPGGLLIMSTPDRQPYNDATGQENPFHERELDRDEFGALLRTRFDNMGMWGQRTVTGSALSDLGVSTGASDWRTFFVEREGEEWNVAPGISPLYLIAIASDAPLPTLPPDSTLADCGIELVDAARQDLARELEGRSGELARLRALRAHDEHTISSLNAELAAARRKLVRVEGSVTWNLFQRIRGVLFGALGGERSSAVLALQRSLRRLGRALRAVRSSGTTSQVPLRRARLGTGPIELPSFDRPDVSLVIPLHSRADLTRGALETIVEHTPHIPYEVILVEDDADRATKDLLEQVRGARILSNEHNLGYMRSVERGVAEARGRWLVLCNNDIEVQPGWLASLLECGESASDVAVVAPKYLYPDGRLAEAGGLIWRDGTGANYGRDADPSDCQYEYRREVDYGSAAALLVRADVWRELGGFDERFLPMYYEDADLCFAVRERGYRVLFEPGAQVIHHEGATAGVDLSSGHKRNQALNRPKFVEKWGERLRDEHFEHDRSNLWRAANRLPPTHVLIADHLVPTWDRDAGSLRMRRVIETLLGMGCHVTLLPDNLSPTQPYTRELQRMGVQVLYHVDARNELANIGPSLSFVLLSRPHVANRWLELIREFAPRSTVVYDTVDLHWIREARRAATDNGGELVASATVDGMRELELALIRAADATVVVSDSERAIVEANAPQAAVHVLGLVHELAVAVRPAVRRRGVLFVGSFDHPPNVDAAVSLVRDVMPIVWDQLGDVSVAIVGANAPPEVAGLASDLVDVKGWVPELDPLLEGARALVAPLTYGAGMKGKVTQALAAGLPVVTTPVGAEGLDAVDGEDLLIGSTREELAERVIRVLSDDELWGRLSRAGQQLVAERCSPALMAETLTTLLDVGS